MVTTTVNPVNAVNQTRGLLSEPDTPNDEEYARMLAEMERERGRPFAPPNLTTWGIFTWVTKDFVRAFRGCWRSMVLYICILGAFSIMCIALNAKYNSSTPSSTSCGSFSTAATTRTFVFSYPKSVGFIARLKLSSPEDPQFGGEITKGCGDIYFRGRMFTHSDSQVARIVYDSRSRTNIYDCHNNDILATFQTDWPPLRISSISSATGVQARVTYASDDWTTSPVYLTHPTTNDVLLTITPTPPGNGDGYYTAVRTNNTNYQSNYVVTPDGITAIVGYLGLLRSGSDLCSDLVAGSGYTIITIVGLAILAVLGMYAVTLYNFRQNEKECFEHYSSKYHARKRAERANAGDSGSTGTTSESTSTSGTAAEGEHLLASHGSTTTGESNTGSSATAPRIE